MFRSRIWRSLLLILGMVAVLYLTASLFLPSSRRLIVGVDRRTGKIRQVESRLTFLPPLQFYRLSFEKREGYAQHDGITRIISQDGVPVTVNYRLRFAIAGDRLPDVRRLVNDGFTVWMQARVAEAVSAVARQVPIEDLLSPTSTFNTQRDPLRRTVAGHLAASGLKVTAFEIARLDVDREALLRVKRAQLRRDARSVPARVAIFAIDGADWDLLTELKNDDRIPNLKALMAGGTLGSVQTIQPTVAPLVWTTVATGLPPDRHGVIDFIDRSRNAPVDANTRRAPALWDIAEAFGRGSAVVNWWTAWPPTSLTATIFDTPGALLTNAISPPEMQRLAASFAVPLQTVGYDQVHRFLNISPAEYDKAVSSGNAADPVNMMRFILAKTWTDHRVAINAFREKQPLLMMMEYDGTDAVNHLFAPFHPPQRGDISDNDYRKYWPAVANYYAEIDRLIGEWMTVLPPDTTVVLMSAYGFRWGKNRPTEMPKGGAALSDHRNPGVFIGYGQHIAHGGTFHPISVYDVAPTVLTLLGLPKSVEMPGQIATWALKDVAPIDSVRVVSYAEFVGDRPEGVAARVDLHAFQQLLQAIGHLNDPTRNLTPVLEQEQPASAQKPLPPEKWGLYAYYNNLGVQLRGQGKIKDAADALQQAVELNPNRWVPNLNLAMVLFDRIQYTQADQAFLQAVADGLPNAEQYFIDFAALYRAHDMSSRAIALLYKGKELFPQSYLIAANLGASLMAASRYTEGQPELERALGLQPSSTMVLDNLGLFYAKKNDYARALDYWNRSLSIDPRQPDIRTAADAARTRL
jgi:predicted AlkP superfamily phosphohydrolase/phosphomutase/Tfp pilus assembly protein PilF